MKPYLPVPAKRGALAENSGASVVKCQFNTTRIFLIEEKHV